MAIIEFLHHLPWPLLGLFIITAASILIWKFPGKRAWQNSLKFKSQSKQLPPPPEKSSLQSMGVIEPLHDLDISQVEPQKIWKFSPKYFLTMGLQNTTVNEIAQFDNEYLSRIAARAQIIRDHPGALHCFPSAVPAAEELYAFLVRTYLPQRYPSIFKLAASHLSNLLTGEDLPLTPPSDTLEALRILAVNIDQDFLLLLPSPDGDGVSLQSAIWCYPIGFKPHELKGQKLRDIHKPVPGYKAKLESSMDRYFGRLQPGKYVYRANWSISMTDTLYIEGGHHIHEEQEGKLHVQTEEEEEEEETSSDLNNARVRCELQTLFALPDSGARVFSVHTYLYPLQQIKDEGASDQLYEAIDGLAKGNVPGIAKYKRAVVWGERVKEFLKQR